jgi:transcriptional regulator with XRE-family HTH domain
VPATKKSSAKAPLSPRRATSFEPKVAAAFGRVIRAHREQSGIAQDAFALMANVDRSYYGKLERGERQPSLALLLRIAGALNLAGGTLVAQTENEL